MSGYQNAGWLSRLMSLARPGNPEAEFVANVNVVNDARWRSSRERAPYAAMSNFALAAGAGVHNFVEIGGLDPLGYVGLLHYARFEAQQSNQITGLISWVLADGAALTTATRVATTPLILDSEPADGPSIQLFEGTIATANIPATAENLPKSNAIGQTLATPAFPTAITEIPPLQGLPFAMSWLGPRRLIFFGGNNETLQYYLAWQAMRA